MSVFGNLSDIQKDIEHAENANANDPQALFDIYVYDDQAAQAKMQKFVTLGSFKNVQGTKLSDIRRMLKNENGLSFRLQGSPFCNKVGAVANDDLPFAEYIKLLERGGKKSEKSEQKSEGQGYSVRVPTGNEPVTETQAYAVYFKSLTLPSGMSDVTKEFLKEKLDLQLRKAELNAVDKPDILASSYNHSSFMAGVGKGTVVNPADMTQGQWNIVMETNALLHGSYVRLPHHGVAKKVERAMYPAFKLKPRRFRDFSTSLDHKGIEPPEWDLFIPRYRVEDDSYVEVSEKKSSVAWAIASSSLSETAAEVAVGGGFFGYSAGAQGGFKNEDATSTTKAQAEQTKHMIITYNFPRVVLQFDEESLQVSDECAKALENVKDKASVEAFKANYGTFFATRVELGGRLHATEDSAALGNASVSEKSKAMKAAASLSFSSPWVQASATASSASSSASKSQNSDSSLNVGMMWEAKGGDTLLCNNPSAWCATVASFYNWRVVKQENLLSIEDMISRIPGYPSVKDKFKSILERKEERSLSEGTVKVRFKEKTSGLYLFLLKPNYLISNTVNHPDVRPREWTPTVAKWVKENGKVWCCVNLKDKETPESVFNVHGIINTTNSKGRILSGGCYTICGDMDNTYLQGTSMIPEFKKSFLHEGAKETAWTFNMKSMNPAQKAGADLEPGDEVQIEICDDKREPLGLMSVYWTPCDLAGVSEKPVLTFSLDYIEN